MVTTMAAIRYGSSPTYFTTDNGVAHSPHCRRQHTQKVSFLLPYIPERPANDCNVTTHSTPSFVDDTTHEHDPSPGDDDNDDGSPLLVAMLRKWVVS